MNEPLAPTAPDAAPDPPELLPTALPAPPPSRTWAGRAFLAIFLMALLLPAIAFEGDRYWLPMITRYMCLALFALSVDLIWGYTGLLSLAPGLYFALGVYAMGYSLKLPQPAISAATLSGAAPGFTPRPQTALPHFTGYCP